MPKRTYQDPLVYEYMQSMKSFLATTRFNNQTWAENQHFLRCHIAPNEPKIQCLYPCSVIIAERLPIDASIFVLEMNNEMNQIEGIGLIRHRPPSCRKYQVYTQNKYNEYSYQGAHHICRSTMNETEMDIIKKLDHFCFKGKRHQKRMNGIKLFPPDILYEHKISSDQDILLEIAQMFKKRFL